MPKLKPETQARRRGHILDAAERCFAGAGFHATTMQDICREAQISPGALYLYFGSKEDLIAGIAERDRAEFAERFAVLAAAPDFLAALDALARRYFLEEPVHKRLMCIEIGIEATRNARIAAIFGTVDGFVRDSFAALFARLAHEGRIRPDLSIDELVQVFMVMGDGLFWRRAVARDFDPDVTLKAVLTVMGGLLNPVPAGLPIAGQTVPMPPIGLPPYPTTLEKTG